MPRPLGLAPVLLIACGALACSGAQPHSAESKAPPPPLVTPTAVLAPMNGCPYRLGFAWSPDGELTIACDNVVHRFDRLLRERSVFAIEDGSRVIDMAYGERSGPIWIAREDGTLLALDARTRRALATLQESKIARTRDRLLFPSQDGHRVGVLVNNGIAIHDLAKEERTVVETDVASGVAWSPDATRIAYWKRGRRDEQWLHRGWSHDLWLIAISKVGADQPERVIPAYHPWLSSLRFTADGKRLLSTMVDDVALVGWDLATGEKTLSVGLPFALPETAQEPPDARYYYSQFILWNHSDAAVLLPDESGVVRLPIAGDGLERHDFASAEPRWNDRFAEELGPLAVSPKGDFVAAWCESPPHRPALCIWDLGSGERRVPASPAIRHTSPVTRLQGSTTGEVLVTSSYDDDYDLRIWDLARGTLSNKTHIFPTGTVGGQFGHVRRVRRSRWSLSPNGERILVVRGKRADADIHDTRGSHEVALSGEISSTAWSDDKLVALRGGKFTLWTLAPTIREQAAAVLPVEPPIALSPDGTRFAALTKAGGLELRSTAPPFSVIAAHRAPSGEEQKHGGFGEIAIHKDSRTVAVTLGNDVFLWDTGEDGWRGPLARPAPHGPIQRSSAPEFSADGRTIRFADKGCVIWSFDVRTTALVGAASICDATVSTSPTRSTWRERPQKPPPFESLPDPLFVRLSWAPRWFASATEDGSIELRRAPGEPLLITLRAIAGLDAGYVFTPDGRFDLVGGHPEIARQFIGCSKAGAPVPLHACEALHAPGLLAQVIASLPAAAP